MQFICRLVCFSLLFLIPGIGTTANADLIAHLTANGTPNDFSGNGHHGTLFGNTTYAAGKLGQAFSFDGADDYVVISTDAALEPANFSVTAWVNVANTGALTMIADSNHGTGNAGWALQVTQNDGRPRFAFGNGSGFPETIATTDIYDSNFHHLAGVFDGTNLKIYVDGVEEGSLAYVGTPTHSGRDLRIGAWWNSGGSPTREANGLIDDIRFYNHALSQSEITSLASVPEPSSMAMLAIVAIGFTVVRRRKNAG